jgi:hypothetical protein
MTGPSLVRVRTALDQAGRRYDEKGNHIQAACPLPYHKNDDRAKSLSIDYKPEGGLVGWWCHVCGPQGRMDEVRVSLGLKPADLFDEPTGNGDRTRHAQQTRQNQRTDKKARQPVCGDHDKHAFPATRTPDNPSKGETWYPREWERGKPVAWKVRSVCIRCGARTFRWRQPDGRGGIKPGKADGLLPLSGLPDVRDKINELGGVQQIGVYGTEGDSDAEVVRAQGYPAVTAGGVNDWQPEHLDQLVQLAHGISLFVFASDADDSGQELAERMRGWLIEREIEHRITKPREPYKDLREQLEDGWTLGELVEIEPERQWSRWVDLRPYLDGTHVNPEPNVGGRRDDDIQVIYPRRWHTNVALTGAGKTAFGLWHAKAIILEGGHVIYLHFEEPEPDGIIDRLRGMGLSEMMIDLQFHWADCSRNWAVNEMAHYLSQFKFSPNLAILDGINAACTLQGWLPNDPNTIGSYRAMFVTPLVKAGSAVLSLGHPPKARDRQNEIHGFGSTAWLDEVDGVGFRMVASKDRPGDRRQGRFGAVRRERSLQPGEALGQPRHDEGSALVLHGHLHRR